MDGQRGRDVAIAVLTALAIALAAVAAAPMFAGGPGEGTGDETGPTSSDGRAPDGEPEPNVVNQVWLTIVTYVLAIWRFVVFAIERALSYLGFAEIDPPGENTTMDSVPVENRSDDLTPAATPNGSGGFGQGAEAPFALPIDGPVLIALVGAILLLVVVLAVRYDVIRSIVGRTGGTGGSESQASLDAIGRVAGDAADRVEAADTPAAADNAIFRAWSEMVGLLDVPDPQSGTPRQFADAAVDAGMDPDDVAALTRTFEEVRYGGAPPSDDRRQAATDAFRRIESEYGEESDTTDASTTDAQSTDRTSEGPT